MGVSSRQIEKRYVPKRLYRSRDSFIGGVCSGIAEYLEVDSIVARIIACLVALISFGAGAIVYIILWTTLPLEPDEPEPVDVTPEEATSNLSGTQVGKARKMSSDVARQVARNVESGRPYNYVSSAHMPPRPPASLLNNQDSKLQANLYSQNVPMQPVSTHQVAGARQSKSAKSGAVAKGHLKTKKTTTRPDVSESERPSILQSSFFHGKGNDNLELSGFERLVIVAGLAFLFILIAVGLGPRIHGVSWIQFWPISFIIAGLAAAVVPMNSKREMTWHLLGLISALLGASLTPMSLGFFSWQTMTLAFERFGILFIAATVLFVIGVIRNSLPLLFAGTLVFALFCFLGTMYCATVGPIDELVLTLPSGRSFTLDPLPIRTKP